MVKSDVITSLKEFKSWSESLPFNVECEYLPNKFPCIVVYGFRDTHDCEYFRDSRFSGEKEIFYDFVYLEEFKGHY